MISDGGGGAKIETGGGLKNQNGVGGLNGDGGLKNQNGLGGVKMALKITIETREPGKFPQPAKNIRSEWAGE